MNLQKSFRVYTSSFTPFLLTLFSFASLLTIPSSAVDSLIHVHLIEQFMFGSDTSTWYCGVISEPVDKTTEISIIVPMPEGLENDVYQKPSVSGSGKLLDSIAFDGEWTLKWEQYPENPDIVVDKHTSTDEKSQPPNDNQKSTLSANDSSICGPEGCSIEGCEIVDGACSCGDSCDAFNINVRFSFIEKMEPHVFARCRPGKKGPPHIYSLGWHTKPAPGEIIASLALMLPGRMFNGDVTPLIPEDQKASWYAPPPDPIKPMIRPIHYSSCGPPIPAEGTLEIKLEKTPDKSIELKDTLIVSFVRGQNAFKPLSLNENVHIKAVRLDTHTATVIITPPE